MVRVLHLADLHLGWSSPLDELPNGRVEERDARLGKAIDWALEQRIDLVLIAGDLFETHTPDRSLVSQAKGHLARAVRAGVVVVTLPGNHDEISYHNSVYREHADDWPGVLIRNPHFAHACSVTVGGERVHLYALAYTGGLTQTHPPLSQFERGDQDGYHVALLHGSLEHDHGDRSLPIDLNAIAQAGFDYVALGHIHRHRRYGVAGRPIVYAGMIEGKGFDDPGVGHYTVARLKGGGATLETHDAKARRLHTFDVDVGAFTSLEELTESVCGSISEGDLVRLRLRGAPEYPFDSEAIRLGTAGRASYVEIQDQTDALRDDALATLAEEPTIRGAFVARMLHRMREAGDDTHQRRVIRRAIGLGLRAMDGNHS